MADDTSTARLWTVRPAPPWKPGQSGNPSGRKRKPLPHDAPQIVEALASRGVNQRLIARALGMCGSTFRERKRSDDAIRAALERGKRRAREGPGTNGALRKAI